ncbi:MAG: hypothetical protein H6740_29595 [Alphaproteobacteria bacterium]|nr:hypothetical protein [Alphaproteobacteria bacterium]
MSARRFRLDIVGELEDRPRLLRAYGKVRGAELAVVLRPTEHRGLFVVLGKEACTAWSADLVPSETRARGRLVIGAKTEVHVDGRAHRIAGTVPAGLADGTLVEVALDAASGGPGCSSEETRRASVPLSSSSRTRSPG